MAFSTCTDALRRLSTFCAWLAMAWALASGAVLAQTRTGPTALTVSGAVRAPLTLDLAALQALPQSSAVVGTKSYGGTSLWALLSSAGIQLDTARRNPGASMYVVATGDDGYKAVFSLAEIDPALGGKSVLVAYSANGAPLEGGGVARLVVTSDLKPSRAVFRLANISVHSAP